MQKCWGVGHPSASHIIGADIQISADSVGEEPSLAIFWQNVGDQLRDNPGFYFRLLQTDQDLLPFVQCFEDIRI